MFYPDGYLTERNFTENNFFSGNGNFKTERKTPNGNHGIFDKNIQIQSFRLYIVSFQVLLLITKGFHQIFNSHLKYLIL